MKKTRVLKSWSKRNVPDDLWPEILSRLPVKALVRFRSVSRSWRTLIDDPDFARLHLTRLNNNRLQSHLFCIQQGAFRNEECFVRSSETLRTTFRLGFLPSRFESVDTFSLRKTPARGYLSELRFVCSIDGLFMLHYRGGYKLSERLMLWNPSIRKTLFLPPSPAISNKLDFGLGFDPSIRDYKFVRIGLPSSLDAHKHVAIYTVGTNSWKSIEFQGEGCSGWGGGFIFASRLRPICFKGVLYGLGKVGLYSSNPFQLVSFDLSSERFASNQLPISYGHPDYSQGLTLIDGGRSLALVNLSKSKGSIWALESLGADIKWTQRYTFATTIPECGDGYTWDTRFLSLKKNGHMLLKWPKKVTSFNLETHEEKIMLKKRLEGWPYMESLILL